MIDVYWRVWGDQWDFDQAHLTANLRNPALNPDDPAKFDFSMCHIGMMNACGFEKKQGDSRCPLKGACRPRAHPPSEA